MSSIVSGSSRRRSDFRPALPFPCRSLPFSQTPFQTHIFGKFRSPPTTIVGEERSFGVLWV